MYHITTISAALTCWEALLNYSERILIGLDASSVPQTAKISKRSTLLLSWLFSERTR